MTADWTTCRVVRDADGYLWGPARGGWMHLDRLSVATHTADEVAAKFGPLTPVLDADGLPVVTAVGDLTARHIGRRVLVEDHTFATLGRVLGTRTLVSLRGFDTDGQWKCLEPLPLDAPCEVLP